MRKKSLIALSLTVIMSVSLLLGGCSGTESPGAAATDKQEPAASEQANQDGEEDEEENGGEDTEGNREEIADEVSQSDGSVDKLKKYDPPITLSFNKSEVVTDYPSGQDAQNNQMYEMWEEVMGIKVENKILTPSASMTEKMQLAISSDDIPDFGIVDSIMLDTLIKNDMIEDMTDVYETWATDNLKEVVGQNDNGLFAAATHEGRYMAIPVANTLGDSYPIMYIRQDWLDALGLDAPTTMDEAFEVAMAFATQDPDGNGADDTYGLYLDKDLGGIDYIMAAYEVYSADEYWVQLEDGSFIAGCTDDRAKKPLQKLSELYAAGGIDREFAVKDESKASEDISAGKIGIFIGLFFHPLSNMKDCVANIEGADWTPIPMPPAEGVENYKPGVAPNVYGYIYVKKGIENPEAAVVMLNHLCDGYAAPWLTEEDSEFYTRYTELAAIEEIRMAGPNNLMPFQMAGNINWGEVYVEAYEAGELHVEGKDADYQNVLNEDLEPEMQWAWKKVYLEAYLCIDFDNVRYSDYAGAPTATAVKTQSLLNTQKQKDYIQIIMGEEDVDYFDTFVTTYNDMGAAKICEEIEEALK